MESVLETQRRLHEERERLVDTMTREWLHDKKNHKEKINSEQRLKLLLDRYLDGSSKLAELYQDGEGARDVELQAVAGPNEFAEFYSRLKALKDAHRRNPDEIAVPLSMEFQEMNEAIDNPNRVETDLVEFTDEEGYGRFLDMHLLFEKYLNLKGVRRVDYVTYLSIFDHLFELSKDVTKKTGAYREYLQALVDYLRTFLMRTRPLHDIKDELNKCAAEFDRKWTEGSFPGWPQETTSQGALTHSGAYLDLSPFSSAAELEQLGLDRLKSALIALNLKCGGTLQERAKRLFATKGKKTEELDASLFAAQKGNAVGGGDQVQKSQQRVREIAALEAQLYRLSELLSEEREATKENVERKQARTVGEEEEEEVEEPAPPSDDENDDDVPYNPKNLPLGWDGKPIPYWLYKLHGLNISYPCEICGNQVYKGPKAFQRHFTEWRHSHGMRCLGIPNTAHFANITKIADAIELWQKIREQKDTNRWRPEVDEEYEDSAGNVVNRRTFEDLKRQGLL
uniref:Matrin-type domain-containing protein n=1 Tax=Plectus sambesii TaxID=2011161 RepID=A0A914WN70_9BILA